MDKIILNDGNKDIEFELLDTFGIDDKDYASLLNSETEEIYLLEIKIEGNETFFSTIDNQQEFDEVMSFYMELLDDLN